MQTDAIYAALTTVFRDAFDSDDMQLTPELTAQNVPGWDSFKQIEIILAVERKFAIKFISRDIDTMACVGDLVNVIAARAA